MVLAVKRPDVKPGVTGQQYRIRLERLNRPAVHFG